MDRKVPEKVAVFSRGAQDECRLPSLDASAGPVAFASWVRESPANLTAFLLNTMLSVELNSLDSERQLDLDALIESATRQAQAPADDLHESEHTGG